MQTFENMSHGEVVYVVASSPLMALKQIAQQLDYGQDHTALDIARDAIAKFGTEAPPSGTEQLERAAASVADMVAEWYRAAFRGDKDIPADLIARRLARFSPYASVPPSSPAP